MVVTLLVVLAFTTASAVHEPCGYQDRATATVSVNGSTWYAVADGCDDPCASVWLFEESNGEPGLQRGDGTIEDVGHPCVKDMLIL